MNYKIYSILSIIIAFLLFPIWGIGRELFVYLGLYLVIVFFFLLLFYLGRVLFRIVNLTKVAKKDTLKALVVILGKNLVMMAAIYWGYTIIGKKIIGVVALYFLQMLLMYISIKYNNNK